MPSTHITPSPTDKQQSYAEDIRTILSTTISKHTSIRSFRPLPHNRLQQAYEVQLSDSSTMIVVMPPPPMERLLRSEHDMVKCEAVVVRWIREEAFTSLSLLTSRTYAYPLGLNPPEKVALHEPPISRTTNVTVASLDSHRVKAELLRFFPSPVPIFPIPRSPASTASTPLQEFSIFTQPSGQPISELSAPLTVQERLCVDYQAGKLLGQLSHLSSQSGRFGPALAVLTPQTNAGAYRDRSSVVSGMNSWSVAFNSILEGILRDGEDVAVALAYPMVRKQFRRFGHLLDAVTTASLVVVDAMDDSNLLVRRSIPSNHADINGDTINSNAQYRRMSLPSKEVNAIDHSAYATNNSSNSPPLPYDPISSEVTVTGLRDWSHCVFGDPLFASVFCEEPSDTFFRGFDNGLGNNMSPDLKSALKKQEQNEDKEIRLLLYQCYHAIVQIVKGFYRLGHDRTTQELAARRRLTETLAKLEAIDDDSGRMSRIRRPSGEMSPAKKPRS